jgi:hypothetical protein
MMRSAAIILFVGLVADSAHGASTEWLKGLRWSTTEHVRGCTGGCRNYSFTYSYRITGSNIYALTSKDSGTMYPVGGEIDLIKTPKSLGKFAYTNSYNTRRIVGSRIGERSVTLYQDSNIVNVGPDSFSETFTFSQDLKTCKVTAYSATSIQLLRSTCRVLK